MFKIVLIISILISSFSVAAQNVDPTKPLTPHLYASTEKASYNNELTLESVIHTQGKVRVVINGKVLKQGDRINQYLIEEIKDKLVVLISPEDTVTLSLFRNQVIKATTKEKQL